MFEDLTAIGPDTWLQFAGRLHVAVVHFPIGLLVVAALLEFVRVRRGRFEPRPAALTCLGLGALSAVLAAVLGWIFAEQDPVGSSLTETLRLHRWVGVAVASISMIAWFDALGQRKQTTRGQARRMRFLLLLAAVGVAVSGHLGGAMQWGGSFLIDPLRDALEAAKQPESGVSDTAGLAAGRASDRDSAAVPGVVESAPDPQSASSDGDPHGPSGSRGSSPGAEAGPGAGQGAAPGAAPEPTGQEPDFAQAVWPILAGNCLDCHGPRKQKGGLRVDSSDDLFGGEVFDGVVVRGYPDASELVRRLELPADDPDFMPFEGDPLPAADIATLRAWIEFGALWDAAVVAASEH